MKKLSEIFLERIIELMGQKKINRTDFAKLAKIKPTTMSNFFNRNSDVSLDTAQKFSKALGVDLVTLIQEDKINLNHRIKELEADLNEIKTLATYQELELNSVQALRDEAAKRVIRKKLSETETRNQEKFKNKKN